jgi:hypothetical protein
MGAGEAEQGLEGGHRGPTPVEAEHELVQVRVQVLAVNTMVCAAAATS